MGSALSKSKHVFFMGAMVEHGIVKQYLDDNCDNNQYKLCAYKDSLPDRAYKFIWEEETSPFYKIGGWKDTKAEFTEIINATLTQPKYIKMHIKESAKATVQQLGRFEIGDGNGSFLKGTLLYERIGEYCSKDLTSYSNSRQSQSKLGDLPIANSMFKLIIITTLLVFVFLFVLYKKEFKNIKGITLIIIIAIIINSWDCGTFANAIDRLGCKMIWLIPLLTAAAISIVIQNKNYKSN
jgi:hypothetical protein